jgi:flagellar motility protein MotE (MotC chaperone)
MSNVFDFMSDPEYLRRLDECAKRNEEIWNAEKKQRQLANLIKRQKEFYDLIAGYCWQLRHIAKGAKNEKRESSRVSPGQDQQPIQPD